MHQLMTLSHFFFKYFFFSSSEFILNVIDNMFARDMYQVYEIK